MCFRGRGFPHIQVFYWQYKPTPDLPLPVKNRGRYSSKSVDSNGMRGSRPAVIEEEMDKAEDEDKTHKTFTDILDVKDVYKQDYYENGLSSLPDAMDIKLGATHSAPMLTTSSAATTKSQSAPSSPGDCDHAEEFSGVTFNLQEEDVYDTNLKETQAAPIIRDGHQRRQVPILKTFLSL